MIIDDKIRRRKLQYDINREIAKVSVLLSGKIYKYEYLTGEEILSFDQRRMIGQAKFIQSPIWKALKKQRQAIQDQGIKQVEALKALKPEEELEPIDFFQKIWQLMKLKNEKKN